MKSFLSSLRQVAHLYRAIQQTRILRFISICFLTLLFALLTATAAYAVLGITPTTTAAVLQTALQGNNVTISNVTVSQGITTGQVGTFAGGLTGGAGPVIGIDSGVVMVTGTATTALGPNNNSSRTTGGETGPTDANLTTVDSGPQFDTAILSFNVVPSGNFMALDFVFGSDEYNEFVCTVFNDAMGIFVSGPGITGTANIARLSTTLSPISINQINRGIKGVASTGTAVAPCTLTNGAFYVKNIGELTAESTGTPNSPLGTATSNAFTNLQYDGFTTPLTAQVKVTPGLTYTVKVVIADIGDSAWDSGLFIDGIRSFNLDLGDAPNSYGTTPIDQSIQLPGPARHSIGQDIYLGATAPDAENTVVPATSPNDANADDSNGTNDEDAFSSDLAIAAGITSHSINNIPVHNGTVSTAKLMGWIDFNKDGDFLDVGELATVNVAPAQTTANLSWSGFTAPTVGTSYARFRITTDPNITNVPTPLGLALNGEVEDYRVVISINIAGTVFNDTDSSKIQSGTEAGTNGGGLNAVLLDTNNAVVATTIVAANGTYNFSNVAPATYTVLITTGTTATVTLPTNWVSTGENLNGVADTTVDSKLLNIVVGTSSVTGANFGIKQNPADVLLLKRITAINGLSTNPNDNTTLLTGVLVDPNWKAGYVVGATNGGPVKPGDTIEYTIYYLNNGGRNAKSVRICDRLNANQTFYPDTYPNSTFIQNNTTNPNPVGSGMQVQKGISAALTLTNTSDGDGGQFITATGAALPTNCNSLSGAPNNDYGALILDLVTNPASPNLTTLPARTSQGAPNDSFGFWRFITKVNQVSP
jgi:GEVED domain/SdrD B-like domain